MIDAGAFSDVDASMMIHPVGKDAVPAGTAGVAYGTCLTGQIGNVEFTGKAAHCGTAPWEGINALDAATLAYMPLGCSDSRCDPRIEVGLLSRKVDRKAISRRLTRQSNTVFGLVL